MRLDHEESAIALAVERLQQLGELALPVARRSHAGHQLELGSARRIGGGAVAGDGDRILDVEVDDVPGQERPRFIERLDADLHEVGRVERDLKRW